MAQPRRPRGTMVDPVSVGYRIERSLRDKVQHLADNAGVSGAVMLEFIIEQTEVTAQGLPAGWPTTDRDGELPIDVP